MRLIVVMEHYPIPARTGSAIVAFNTLKHLSVRHEVDLICFRPEGDVSDLGLGVRDVHLVRRESAGILGTFLKRLLYWVSPYLDFRGDRGMRAAIREAARVRSYDAILLFELGAIKHCPSGLLHKVAVNMEDPQSIRLLRMARLPVWPTHRRWKLVAVAWLTRRYERVVLPRIGRLFLLSRMDIEDLRVQGLGLNLEYLPYGVDVTPAAEVLPYRSRKKAIVYSGNMFHPPNVDGALFFLSEIFPCVLRRDSSIVLWIVGADPDERIIKAAGVFGASVKITGRVTDMSSYLAVALVSICPVRLRIGVQTKILESLSLGTPVVTTSAGNRGIGGVSGVHLHVEDDVEQFATKICDLVDGKNWERLSTEGRAFAERNFSWDGSVQELERQLLGMPGS